MFRFDRFPFSRVATYDDTGAGPQVTAAGFYNPVQDDLALLAGGLFGKTTSIASDDFEVATAVSFPLGIGQRLGSDFYCVTATNCSSGSAVPVAAGDHGIWKTNVTAAAAWSFEAVEALCNLGSNPWLFHARVKVVNPAGLHGIVNNGALVGLGSTALKLQIGFKAGVDQPNWQTWDGTNLTDSGVALVANTWYWLGAAFVGGTLYWYIDGIEISSVPAFVSALSGVGRYYAFVGTGASNAGDGFYIDHFSRGFVR